MILLAIQILAFSVSQIVIPFISIFQKIKWIEYDIGFPLLIISIITKLIRQRQFFLIRKKVVKMQISFMVPYAFTALACYFFYQSIAIIPNIKLSNVLFPIITLILQAISYSLVSTEETICKIQHITYSICLVVWVFTFGYLTVLIINLGDQGELPDNYKDLTILVCTTIVALGILIMDIISRAIDKKQQRQGQQKQKQMEMKILQ